MTSPDSKRITHVTIQGVGPLTRATVGPDPVDPGDEALNDVLHWIWSWQVQVGRLSESFEGEWKDGTDIERRKAASRFSYDEHMLVVTGGNLVRAIKRAQALFPSISLSEDRAEALRLLRNVYEHWDEQREAFRTPDAPKDQSGAAFARQFPQGQPWSMVFDRDDWVLSGVVRLNDLTRSLQALETAALAAEADRQRGP